MTLRPDSGPARLLLELRQAQATGQRDHELTNAYARRRLLDLELLQLYEGTERYALTAAGREVARALQARIL